MPIKASSARQVDELIADLESDDLVARDAAVARLTIVGARAVDRLTALFADNAARPRTRAAALRALEGIPDSRGLAAAIEVLGHADDEVALAAIALVRNYLAGEEGVRALDALTAVAVQRRHSDPVREAAIRALDGLEPGMRGPLMEALLTDPSPRLRALAQGASVESPDSPPAASWLDAAKEGGWPSDPDQVRHELIRRGGSIDLPRLHQAIQRIRDRESDGEESQRRGWLVARAEAHLALAHRGSRLALYDLRELLAAANQPLPLAVLEATAKIGDMSCLEPLAELYGRTVTGPPVDSWQVHLREAFQAILAREGITSRHAVAKRIKARAPAAWLALAGSRGGTARTAQ